MSPAPTLTDVAHNLRRHSVSSRCLRTRHPAVFDGSSVRKRQLGRRPSLSVSVVDVVENGPKPQMLWVDAGGRIATMKNLHSSRNRAVPVRVRNSMRSLHCRPIPELPIPSMVHAGRPEPTRPRSVDLRQEAVERDIIHDVPSSVGSQAPGGGNRAGATQFTEAHNSNQGRGWSI